MIVMPITLWLVERYAISILFSRQEGFASSSEVAHALVASPVGSHRGRLDRLSPNARVIAA
jgi:hypothetical protein